MKTLTALLSIAFVMFVQDVNAATFPTIALTDAIVCEQLCTSLDAEENAANAKAELMQQLTPEKVAKAHALANEEVMLYTQMLNSPMAELRVSGVQSINLVQQKFINN
ncbi:hypothetical protein [Vibrio phage vB_pir03]|nr:hypothetical protein [Vibrio phage vB_pir03]